MMLEETGHISNSTTEGMKTKVNHSFYFKDQHILKILRDFLKPSFLLMQVGGYTPYLLSAENELKTCLPLVVVSILQLSFHTASVICFAQFQEKYVSMFGKFTETEMVTTTAFCAFGLIGQLIIRLGLYRNHNSILTYHSELNKVLCELICDKGNVSSNNASFEKLYLKWIKEATTPVRRFCLVIWATILVNVSFFFIPLFLLRPFYGLSLVHKFLFVATTIDFAVGMFPFNGLVIWLGSYIKLKQIAFKIIHHKIENPINEQVNYQHSSAEMHRVESLAETVKQLETLTEQFNGFSPVFLITWMTFIMAMIVTHLYQNLMWIRFQMNFAILASSPSLIAGGISIYFLCTIAGDMTTMGKKSVECLCNRAVEESCAGKYETNDNSVFLKKVSFLHSKWQSKPSQVSPGGYFVLNRHLLTSIIGILTTYLVVLLQFTNETTRLQQAITNATGEFVLPNHGNETQEYKVID